MGRPDECELPLTAPELLEAAAETYRERNLTYGNSYRQHGRIMSGLFPDGVTLDTPMEHNRFGIVTMMVAKLARYANNFHRGGHKDSLHDLQVYAAMLEELEQ